MKDEQHKNKNKYKTIQGICHSSTGVQIGVLVSTEEGEKQDVSGRNELAENNSGEDQTIQDS